MTGLVLGVVVCAVVGAGWIVLAVRRPVAAVLVLVGYVCVSPHLLAGLLQLGAPSTALRAALAAKDVLAWTLLLTLVIVRRGQGRARWSVLVLAAVLVVLLASWHGQGTLESRGVSARDAVVPWVAAATAIMLTAAERRTIAAVALWVIVAAAGYAIVEYMLPVTFLTRTLDIGAYWTAVKHQQNFLVYRGSAGGVVPGNLFTSSGTRRLSGSFGDPLAAGYVLAAGFALALARLRARWSDAVALLVLTSAIVLTFTRAAWIIATLAGVSWLVLRGRRAATFAIGGTAMAAAVVLLTATPVGHYASGVVSGNDSSTLSHAHSLQANLHRHYTLLGSGLGGTGAAAAANGDVPGAVATESVFVTLLLEFGLLLGGVLIAGGLVATGFAFRRAWQHPPRRIWVGAAIGLLATCLLSEELISFNAGWLPVLIVTMGLLGIARSTSDGRSTSATNVTASSGLATPLPARTESRGPTAR